jgi:hypothetical protein
LNPLVFVGQELALRFQNGQKVDQTCPILLAGKINGQLALLHRLAQAIATSCSLRVVHQGVLNFFEGVQDEVISSASQGIPKLTNIE